MDCRSSLALLAMLLCVASNVHSAPAVWSGLVIAQNAPEPTAIPPELTKIEQTLKDLFGYNQFQLIGQSSKTLRSGEEDWLASSKYFKLHVDSQGETDAGYTVNLKLYKEQELLLETDAKLSSTSPLVIKGPQVGDGQLLLVLVVNQEPTQAHHPRRTRSSNPLTTAWHGLRRAIRKVLP
jgi:hypothetical protein